MARYIDVEPLEDKLKEHIRKTESELMLGALSTFLRLLDITPTADVAPVRHGKYIGTEFDGYADGCPVYYEWKCSECGCVFEEEEPTYNYCPNCGARMDGDDNEID